MGLSIKALLDYNHLLRAQDSWDKIVKDCSENPIFLSSFTKEYIELNKLRGWSPLLLLSSVNSEPVGISPLQIKRKFGVSIVSFMHRPVLPDFVIYPKYRKVCLEQIIDFLFKTVKCQLADLTLPVDSPSINLLEQICEDKAIYLKKTCEVGPERGRRIVPIRETWQEFKEKRGKKFRCELRHTKRLLNKTGSWRIVRVKNSAIDEKCIREVYGVDKESWKQTWRAQRGEEKDPYLLVLLNGCRKAVSSTPFFTANVWFLELEEKSIAFAIVVQYKNVAYLIKTSYNRKYRKFHPGKFVISSALREMFINREAKKVDFITDLPFLRTWASVCIPRIKIVVSKKNIIPISMALILSSRKIKKIYSDIQTQIPKIDFW